MTEVDFDSLWRQSASFRHVSHALAPLVERVHAEAHGRDLASLKAALVALLEFLSSEYGRTDANCSATDRFFSSFEGSWHHLPPDYAKLLSDLGGTLHDAIYAPNIAANFECLPEQLLERARTL